MAQARHDIDLMKQEVDHWKSSLQDEFKCHEATERRRDQEQANLSSLLEFCNKIKFPSVVQGHEIGLTTVWEDNNRQQESESQSLMLTTEPDLGPCKNNSAVVTPDDGESGELHRPKTRTRTRKLPASKA